MKSKSALYLVLTFLFIQPAFSQIQSGEITYKVQPPKDFGQYTDTTTTNMKDDRLKAFFKKRYDNIKEVSPYLEFTLKFNKNESRFQKEPDMASDNGIDIESVAGETGVRGSYYMNKEEDLKLHQYRSSLMSGLLLVKSKFNNRVWEIKKAQKVIAGYTCQKAETVIYQEPEKGIKVVMTAWFAPDLPFQYGPLGEGGLPGMILGLKKRKFYFYADKVNLKKRNQKVKRPHKGKPMSHDKLEAIGKKNMEMMKERIKEMHKRRDGN